MRVFLSVVSHNHSQLIKDLGCLNRLAQQFTIVIKSNVPGECFDFLNENIYWINEKYSLGFGENNNIIYSYCEDALEMNREDIFIVFNPDIVANIDDIELLIKYMNQESHPIAAVNLFRDKELSISDNSVRNFPNLIQFSKSFLGLGNTTIINKNQTHKPTKVDWAAGSFLAFKAYHYKSLKGFDEKYFMYCEDIDICYRSNLIGYPVTFFPDIKIQHLAEHANRSILSKHFYWHVKSVFRFLLTRKNLTKSKSSL